MAGQRRRSAARSAPQRAPHCLEPCELLRLSGCLCTGAAVHTRYSMPMAARCTVAHSSQLPLPLLDEPLRLARLPHLPPLLLLPVPLHRLLHSLRAADVGQPKALRDVQLRRPRRRLHRPLPPRAARHLCAAGARSESRVWSETLAAEPVGPATHVHVLCCGTHALRPPAHLPAAAHPAALRGRMQGAAAAPPPPRCWG